MFINNTHANGKEKGPTQVRELSIPKLGSQEAKYAAMMTIQTMRLLACKSIQNPPLFFCLHSLLNIARIMPIKIEVENGLFLIVHKKMSQIDSLYCRYPKQKIS
jgi:hypothetical protein